MAKKLQINLTSGDDLGFTITAEEAQEFTQALATQLPAHPVVLGNERLYVNMRNVCTVHIEDAPDPEPEPEAEEQTEGEEQATTEEAADPAPTDPAPDLNALKKPEVVAALTAAGIDHDPKALKADLVQLAADNNVTPPAPTTE